MTSTGRPRGSIRERGATLQVRVFAGYDPVTGKQRYLTESITGTDRAAHRRAEKALTRLQAQVDKQRGPETSLSLGRALDEWLATTALEDTRDARMWATSSARSNPRSGPNRSTG